MAKTYSKKLSNPKWQKKRLKILDRDKWTCKKCGDTETELHVHHLEYHKNPWDTPDKLLITLCAHCHIFIERIKGNKQNEIKDFNKIKIYKSGNWTDGHKIMFANIGDILLMEIFDENSNYIIGFNFPKQQYVNIKKLI